MLNQHPEALCGFLNNICDCHNSQFVYEPLQHIFTGDLDIIQSNGLRNIFKKGTKFRSITNKHPLSITDESMQSLNGLIQQIA